MHFGLGALVATLPKVEFATGKVHFICRRIPQSFPLPDGTLADMNLRPLSVDHKFYVNEAFTDVLVKASDAGFRKERIQSHPPTHDVNRP